jgi:hypothetical protein
MIPYTKSFQKNFIHWCSNKIPVLREFEVQCFNICAVLSIGAATKYLCCGDFGVQCFTVCAVLSIGAATKYLCCVDLRCSASPFVQFYPLVQQQNTCAAGI